MRPLLLTRKKMIGMAVIVLIVVIALVWVQQKIAGLFQLI
jgi:hypothetical protein